MRHSVTAPTEDDNETIHFLFRRETDWRTLCGFTSVIVLFFVVASSGVKTNMHCAPTNPRRPSPHSKRKTTRLITRIAWCSGCIVASQALSTQTAQSDLTRDTRTFPPVKTLVEVYSQNAGHCRKRTHGAVDKQNTLPTREHTHPG